LEEWKKNKEKKKRKNYVERLAGEILDGASNTGNSVKKKRRLS